MIPLQNMSHHERAATPEPFARYLINLVRGMCGTDFVAALWIAARSPYRTLLPPWLVWGTDRDALTYDGPWPIVAHPPCGPWGKLSWRSRESREHGIAAMHMVDTYGGVVEQPLGSQLFRQYGTRGTVIRVDQYDYGHRALKPTLLYVSDASHNRVAAR